MGSRLYLPFYSTRTNWNCPIQLFTRYCSTRHLLRCSSLPLCIIYRSCFCHYSRVCSLIPIIFWIYPRWYMSKSSLRYYICRSKLDILSTTFPRFIRYTTTLFRLPWCVYYMKYGILNRIIYFTNRSSYHNLHNLRSFRFKTWSDDSRSHINKSRVTTRLPSSIPYIWRTNFRKSKIRKEGFEPPKIGFKPTP